MHHDAKNNGVRNKVWQVSMCQARNRSVQTGGSMGHRNLLATSFQTSVMLIVQSLVATSNFVWELKQFS